jgi:hypothetical protein
MTVVIGPRERAATIRMGPMPGVGVAGPEGPAGSGAAEIATRAAMAALTGVAGTIRNLTEAGREGMFIFSASNLSAKVSADTAQGIYVAPSSDTTGASGAWVRKFNGPVNPLWFGIVTGAGNGAANTTARNAMFAALRARAVNIITFYQGLEPIEFPPGYFEFSTAFDLTLGTFVIRGAGIGQSGGFATHFKFPAGQTGFIVQNYLSTGGTGFGAAHIAGDGSIIDGFLIEGAYAGTEGEFHGIQLRGRGQVSNVRIANFQGNGIHIRASAGDPTYEGNANNFQIEYVTVNGCRNGLYVDGADANAGVIIAGEFSSNRQWGIWDTSFLGNSYFACHTAANGWDGAAGSIPTGSTYLGNRYFVKTGQAAGASTNAPSGTTADNTWWGYIGAGGAYSGVVPWVSGTTFREGGAYHTDDPNARNGLAFCYSESDQNPSQFVGPTMVLGGLHGAGVANYPGFLDVTVTGGLILTNPVIRQVGVAESLTLEQTGGLVGGSKFLVTGENNQYGALIETTHATVQLADLVFKTTASGNHGVRYERRVGSFLDASNATWEFQWGSLSGPIHSLGDAGMRITGTINATVSYKVNGTKVVGARQTGWTASTGTPARGAFAAAAAGTASAGYVQAELQAALDRIAALEARLIAVETDIRTHGLIN